jgi:hypothetical protein
MLRLTEAARAHLAQILDQTEAPNEMTIRFVPTEGHRLVVYLDYARPGDTTFIHQGKVVLALDAQATHALTRHTVDLQRTRYSEPRFILCL